MRKTIKNLALNPLISGSFFLFTGGLVGNLFNFLFNLFMSRNLKVEDYGILISLVSIITLVSISAGAFIPTILTVAGKYFAQEDYSRLHSFYFKMLNPLILIGFIILFLFLVFSKFIGDFFHINNQLLLIITAFSIFLVFIATLSNTFLQAKLAFRTITFINTFSAIAKVIFGVALVFAGLGLSGAVTGLFLAFIIPVVLGIIFLWKIIYFKEEKTVAVTYRELLAYGIPSALIVFSLNAYIATDILLVKHLFSETQAGLYAGLSLVGRVIFFLTTPIGTVMFPIIINRFNTNKNYKIVLVSSLALVGSISVFVTIFYYLFPAFTIEFFLKNNAYLSVSKYLGNFGVFITIYSLVSLLTYYFLSIKKTDILWFLLPAAILQAGLIYMYHESISQIINISSFILAILLLYLLYKFLRNKN